MNCRNCDKILRKRIIKLGKQPISSVFYNNKMHNLKEYSLDLYICDFCKLIQFNNTPPLSNMYGLTYGYRTSLSNYMISHMKEKYDRIIKSNYLNNNAKILDIGSNDGTLLNLFSDHKSGNYTLVGIDPSSKKFEQYYNKDIHLHIDYFNTYSGQILLNKYCQNSKFNLITSFAMFYDVDDPNAFCKSIELLLDDNGKWILELSYFPLLLKNLTYDQICHEHVTYYTLDTFNKIAENNNLKIQDISFNEINGGSIEITCVKKSSNHIISSKIIDKHLELENNINTNAYNRLQKRIDNTKNILQLLLSHINSDEIIAYGASTKGNIVLNHCGITEDKIKYVCDSNPDKYHKYTPGTNIKIISKEQMRKINPKYLLVLIWSFRKEVIIQEENYINNGGILIFHLPSIHIVDKNNYKKLLNDNFDTFSFEI